MTARFACPDAPRRPRASPDWASVSWLIAPTPPAARAPRETADWKARSITPAPDNSMAGRMTDPEDRTLLVVSPLLATPTKGNTQDAAIEMVAALIDTVSPAPTVKLVSWSSPVPTPHDRSSTTESSDLVKWA